MSTEKRICLNQSVLDFMAERLAKCRKPLVLEFGSGWSSAWFAARCSELVTVETDMTWFYRVEKDLIQSGHTNWQVVRSDIRPDEYAKRMAHYAAFTNTPADLILVDCREDLRETAAHLAWQFLKPGGWLVFDDAQRPRHRKTINWLGHRAGVATRLEWAEGDIETARERLALAWRK